MDLSPSSLLAGIIFGTIGFYMIRESRRRGNLWMALIGLALMSYTYFTPNPWVDWGGGVALCALAYNLRNL